MITFLVAAAGFGLGTAYGRFVAPVEYVDTDPSSLRVDFRSDYVLMLAERYAVDHDLDQALHRLALLGPQSPDRLCAEAIRFAQSASYTQVDIQLLQQLLRAVQAQTLLAPTAGSSP